LYSDLHINRRFLGFSGYLFVLDEIKYDFISTSNFEELCGIALVYGDF
jgi:hypothetical protein